jgi:uncharacterized membrane protein YphA (DoxX/SURF4 family)
MQWTGWSATALFSLFIVAASVVPKLANLAVARDTMEQLGWPPEHAFAIGVLELICLVLYLIPRTTLLGAVLFTGLLGGAIATQIRVGSPLFSHILFGVYLGLVMWGGLWFRDPTIRNLLPLRRR